MGISNLFSVVSAAYEVITRSCSRTIRRGDVTCHEMRSVERGVECSCTMDSCNGDDEMMLTAAYAAARDQAIYGSVESVDSSVRRHNYNRNSAAAATTTGSMIDQLTAWLMPVLAILVHLLLDRSCRFLRLL